MTRQRLNYLLEMWARWCLRGSVIRATPDSILARLIEFEGNEALMYGAGGHSTPLDDLESGIESIVMALAAKDVKAAETLRIEYVFCCSDSEIEKAARIGVSVRTYYRKLKKARHFVEESLSDV